MYQQSMNMFLLKPLFIIVVIGFCGCIDFSQNFSQEELEEEPLLPGKRIYDDYCFSCQTPGINGAPRIGDKEAWAARLEQGRVSLLQSTIEGIQPAMPPRGICFDCLDEQQDAAIDYMIGYLD